MPFPCSIFIFSRSWCLVSSIFLWMYEKACLYLHYHITHHIIHLCISYCNHCITVHYLPSFPYCPLSAFLSIRIHSYPFASIRTSCIVSHCIIWQIAIRSIFPMPSITQTIFSLSIWASASIQLVFYG